jgi:uncharacterized SAM-binding protein YcdF (DUF218 family)
MRTRRWLTFLGVVVLLVGTLSFGSTRLLRTAGGFLKVEDKPEKADAILILRGEEGTREIGAAQLFREGCAPKVLYCRARATALEKRGLLPDNNTVTKDILVSMGVPPEKIEMLQPVVLSTYDEALNLKQCLYNHPYKKIIIVTSSFHTRRARWIFDKVLEGSDVEIKMHPVDEFDYNESNWWRTESGLISCFNEYVKFGYYLVHY